MTNTNPRSRGMRRTLAASLVVTALSVPTVAAAAPRSRGPLPYPISSTPMPVSDDYWCCSENGCGKATAWEVCGPGEIKYGCEEMTQQCGPVSSSGSRPSGPTTVTSPSGPRRP